MYYARFSPPLLPSADGRHRCWEEDRSSMRTKEDILTKEMCFSSAQDYNVYAKDAKINIA